jgi:hypothetical protein
MKTSGIAAGQNPVNNSNPLPETTGTTAGPRLSEKAFYLIALVSLLRRSMDPAVLQQLLVPGQYINYSDSSTSSRKN